MSGPFLNHQLPRWPVPDLAKWLLIAAVSFGLIMGIYEYLVRRNNLLRFLFGMKATEAVRETAHVDRKHIRTKFHNLV